MSEFVLTRDQQSAYEAFAAYIMSPFESVFVLSGFSGTGKTTLVKTLIERLPSIMKMAKLLDPESKEYEVALTATTNKAAEAFSSITNKDVSTIHSFLGLRVHTEYSTNTSYLIPRKREDVKQDFLLFIDEASYIDDQLLKLIFQQTHNCKLVFMGDPAQLTPVNSVDTPVFTRGFKGAHLSQIVRQAEGNPIMELSTQFRLTVGHGEFFSFKPDGAHVQWMPREQFDQAVIQEFNRKDWRYQDSKVLGWTNRCVIAYNQGIRNHVAGDPDFQVDDYAINNRYIKWRDGSIKTDELVHITGKGQDTCEHNVWGNYFEIDHKREFFMPHRLEDKLALIKYAQADENFSLLQAIDNDWIDLRAAYACTINKAQGSTYDKVFIDLDDIKRCQDGNQIARMLYVGVSRARHQVVFTGDLV